MNLPDTLSKKIAEYLAPLIVEELKKNEYPIFELCYSDDFSKVTGFRVQLNQNSYFEGPIFKDFNIQSLLAAQSILGIHLNKKLDITCDEFLNDKMRGPFYYDHENNQIIIRIEQHDVLQTVYKCVLTDKLRNDIIKNINMDIIKNFLTKINENINRKTPDYYELNFMESGFL